MSWADFGFAWALWMWLVFFVVVVDDETKPLWLSYLACDIFGSFAMWVVLHPFVLVFRELYGAWKLVQAWRGKA